MLLKIVHEEEDPNEKDDEDEHSLFTKNFKKFLKKVGMSSMFGPSFRKMFKGKNPSAPKNSNFPNNKRGFSVGNVKVSGISNPSVQTLEKRKIRP